MRSQLERKQYLSQFCCLFLWCIWDVYVTFKRFRLAIYIGSIIIKTCSFIHEII